MQTKPSRVTGCTTRVDLTYSDDLHAGVLQPVGCSDGVILRLPIRQEDQDTRGVRPRPRLVSQVLLQDMQQSLACEGVAALVSEVPDGLQQLLFGSEVVELPLSARVSTVLRKGWENGGAINW